MQLQITKSPLFVAPQVQFKVKRREIDPEVSAEDRARRHHGCCEAGHDADADQVLAGEEQTRDVRLGPEARLRPRVEARHVVLKPVELPVELGRNSTCISIGHLAKLHTDLLM